jgi:hypothetical protein
MRMAGLVARMGKKLHAYRLLVGMPEGNRPLGRPRSRWVDNVKIGTSSIDWAQLSRFYLKMEIELSLQNVVFCNINRTVF